MFQSVVRISSVAAVLAAGQHDFPTASRADTFGDVFNYTYDGCTGGCSLPAGTISVSGQGTNVLTYDIDLNSTHVFHQSNAGTTFQFSVSGATVALANISGLTAGFGWTFVTPTNGLDALGTFQYGFNCDGSGTPNNTCGHDLNFTLTFTAGTHAFVANETGGQHWGSGFWDEFMQPGHGGIYFLRYYRSRWRHGRSAWPDRRCRPSGLDRGLRWPYWAWPDGGGGT